MYGDGMVDLFTITLTKLHGSKTCNLKVSEYLYSESAQGFGVGQGSTVFTTRGSFDVTQTPAEIKTLIDAERDAWLNAFPA
jgi:hypothetical protein